ncbi:MAG: hypothetical protein HGB32_11670 [Geobacteraceae bacterium]|nr:hypothetical protein [Geobacteraceae bacterium]NTW80786.1 hypothetical protein [Geobacteraceae bacterium]
MNKIGRYLQWVAYSYTALVFSALLFMYVSGDRWWPATMLLFGPRWLLALPLFLLVPLAVYYDRRLLLPLGIAALIIVGPFMHFNLPLSKVTHSDYSGTKKLRVLTCNLDSAKYDTSHLVSVISESSADIVALQECPEEIKLSLPPGWYMITARGLAVLSRFPLRKVNLVQVMPPKGEWPSTCLLHVNAQTPGGDVAVCSLQLPTPRFGLMQILDRYTFLRPSRSGLCLEETAFRHRAAQEVRRYIDTLSLPKIIAGDFNTPVDSSIYKSVWDDFTNAFSEAGCGYGWSQRVSVRNFSYSVRIDHILTGKRFTPLLSVVGPDIGSDHLPVIADLALVK